VTSHPVRRTPRAEAELLAHVERIAASNLDAALRFVDAVEAALALISELPEMGAPHETSETRLRGIRKWVLPRFSNYVLFYRFDGEVVRLLHVFHGASDYEPDVEE
jgi:plasmid stabilization system protein ParE